MILKLNFAQTSISHGPYSRPEFCWSGFSAQDPRPGHSWTAQAGLKLD